MIDESGGMKGYRIESLEIIIPIQRPARYRRFRLVVSRWWLPHGVAAIGIVACFVIMAAVCGFAFAAEPVPPVSSSSSHPPLSLLFLMDASGSMKQNDPSGLRKAAAQAVVSLLGSADRIAVVEFGEKGRVVAEDKDKPWLSMSERDKAMGLLKDIGDKDTFTDFRAGLQTALGTMESVPASHRKVILLLTDGILEPNPRDAVYTPHQYSYMVDLMKAGTGGRKAVNEEYRQRLTPVAKRILGEEILPALQKGNVEIYTVGLSPQADQGFLKGLADATTRNAVEVHSFYAEKATDLVTVFSQILQYWSDMTVLRIDEGEIRPGQRQSLFLDEYVTVPKVISLVDGEGQPEIRTERGEVEEAQASPYPGLRFCNLSKGTPPGTWTFGFGTGSGRHRTLWIGRNLLNMAVRGLKSRYRFGESVDAMVTLGTERGGAPFIATGAKIVAEISSVTAKGKGPDRRELENRSGDYRLNFLPALGGEHDIIFTAFAKDRQGRDILPRPSMRFRFEVLSNVSVTPSILSFGKGERGKEIQREVEIRSGLSATTEVTVTGRVVQSSRKANRKSSPVLPAIKSQSVIVSPGEVRRIRITLVVPKGVLCGDHEGEVLFAARSGEAAKASFRVYVPSLWDKLKPAVLFIVALLTLVVGYLVYVWGRLASPAGIFRPIDGPAGVQRNPILLSQVRRGVFTRWLSWRRNRVKVGTGGDFPLPAFSGGQHAELFFFNFGRQYLRNPKKGDGGEITVEEGSRKFVLRGGMAVDLKHKSVIHMGGYKLQYERDGRKGRGR